MRLESLPEDMEWTSQYQENGNGGWDRKGLTLIDFGKSIDLSFFKNLQYFLSDRKGTSGDSSYECWEVRNGHEWKYEVDWYGVASVLHVLLFGKYMEVSEESFDQPVYNILNGQIFHHFNYM